MLPLLLMLIEDPATMIASARIGAEQRCTVIADETDITVCGLRNADRFRVPFVVHDAGDPRHVNAWNARVRLLNRTNPVKELSPFLVGGGMVGVAIRSDGSVATRTPAP